VPLTRDRFEGGIDFAPGSGVHDLDLHPHRARAAGSSSLSVNSFWAAEAGFLCCRLGRQSHIVPAASLIPIFFTTRTPCRSVISSFGLAALVFRLISS